MRSWNNDHPRSKVLARKRKAILAAARREFAANGFAGASMTAVAARAGVSTATLYRHAPTKEDLFAAVVKLEGDPDEYGEAVARLTALPPEEMLVAFAEMMIGVLSQPDAIAMHRMVAAEAERFPGLGAILFDAYHAHFREALQALLRDYPVSLAEVAEFLTQALGDTEFRLLLGLPLARKVQDARVRRAAEAFASSFRAKDSARARRPASKPRPPPAKARA